ncbi:MATE family efflux transporter [Legionella worsleiensis]|uniref:MATE efflux family protein n=1 Tax=Legionella worsleiensis TaxID=45076 RepID=A0A0W1A9J6_9GAMM|nr:MATE family efflux transporter [Legionella worsleiensis]KTD78001.1 MATE efflux family protein [Legionella worsleiensis]STY31514.1 MATE efflux family protein [Legionella worsleiensis]
MNSLTQLAPRIKTISLFALPISMTSLVNILANFFAVFFVAQLGIDELAAATLASSTHITVLVTVTAVLYAVSILISHEYSSSSTQEHPQKNIGALFQSSILVSALLSGAAGVLLWHGDKILTLFGQDEHLVSFTTHYFHYAACSLFPNLVAMSVGQFYLGIGNSHFGLINALIRLPFVLFFSYVLVLGRLDFPKMGLTGVTCANFIVNSLYCIIILMYLFFNKKLKPYLLFRQRPLFRWILCQRILKLGIPIGVQFGAELLVMAVMTFLLGFMGVIPLAASQIVSQFSLLAIMLVLGLTQATSILISGEFAKKNLYLIKEYAQAIQTIIQIFFVFLALIFLMFHNLFLSLFMNPADEHNQQLKYYALVFFAISFVTMYFDAVRNSFSAILRGVHDSQSPMKIGLLSLWCISLPCACFFAFGLHWGAIGLQSGFVSGFFVASLILRIKMHRILDNHIDIIRR